MTTTKPSIQIAIKPFDLMADPATAEHWRGIVSTKKGLCYSCVWAGDKPSIETVLEAWKTDRKAFIPYYGGCF